MRKNFVHGFCMFYFFVKKKTYLYYCSLFKLLVLLLIVVLKTRVLLHYIKKHILRLKLYIIASQVWQVVHSLSCLLSYLSDLLDFFSCSRGKKQMEKVNKNIKVISLKFLLGWYIHRLLHCIVIVGLLVLVHPIMMHI